MFWGLIMEPQRRYTQNVKKAFHVSMAALDISSSDSEPTQIMCGFEGRNYLLCTLQKGKLIQCPLDLNFEVGDEVSFATNGNSHVHLTGYLTDEFAAMDEEQEEEEEETEVSPVTKKRTRLSKNGPDAKKMKTAELLDAVDQDSDDDSDFNFSDLLKEDEDEDGEDEEAADEENDNEEDEDEEEEEESEDEVSSLSDEEEEEDEQEEKPKVNGTPLLSKTKNKQQTQTPGKQTPKEIVKTPKQEKQQQQQQKTPKSEKKKQQLAQKGNGDFKEEKTPNKQKLKQENKSPKPSQEGGTPKKRTVEGGIVIEDLKQGEGQVAKPGKICQVYYEGRLKQNNKVFDATSKGPGFKFRLGRQEVIKGWDIGVNGMKVGGKRRIVCPPTMAYGQKGSPPAIPPNSTLVFDVELKAVV